MITSSKVIFLLPLLACVAQALRALNLTLNETYVAANGVRNTTVYNFQPKKYDIDMDLDYEERWRAVMKDMGYTLVELYDIFMAQSGVDEDDINWLTYDMLVAYDLEYAKEVKAISNLANYDFWKVAFLNAFYDITTECLGIIAQDANNNIFHGRNLDFSGIAPVIAEMMFHARFMKGGKVVYESIQKIGQIGLLTAVKNGKFSINLDQNMEPGLSDPEYWAHVQGELTEIYTLYKENYENSLQTGTGLLKKPKMYLTPVYVARRAIETASSYQEMYDILKNTSVLTRAYYILAGVNSGEGAIIQKYGDITEDVAKLSPDGGIWYLVQSNYIRSKPDPPVDNRVSASTALLHAVGRANIDQYSMFEIMHTYPLYNNGTIHTSVMQAKTSLMNTTIYGWSEHRVETAKEELKEGSSE